MNDKIPELTISASSWHFRWYKVWLAYHQEWKSRREDFCHYVRVLVFWAPLTWFFQVPLYWQVTPFLGALGLAILAGLVAAFITNAGVTLILLGVIATAVVAVAAAIALYRFLASNVDPAVWSFLGKALVVIFAGWAIVIVIALDRLVWRPIVEPWLFTRREWLGLRWTLVVIAAIAAIWYFLGGDSLVGMLVFIIWFVMVIIIAVLIVVTLFVLYKVLKWTAEKIGDYINNRPRKIVQQPKGTSTVRLVWEYVKLKKHQLICPYLKMPKE